MNIKLFHFINYKLLQSLLVLGFIIFIIPVVEAQNINPQALEKKSALPLNPLVRHGTLPNGMKYYIQKNGFPEKRAELRLALNAGSLLETDEQQGLAHFTEHMCFNGTKNFPKSALVDFVELIGTKFGPHLNAYTSFDETVYMLRVRTDSAGILEKGLLILEDWAHQVSMDGEEIDKERGVVIEEWRLRRGANQRMADKTIPFTYYNSRYADRLPIGKKEILDNFEHKTIRQFYKDWYRPDLMAIIAVGDFDLDATEKLIKERFGVIPSIPNPIPRTNYEVPIHEQTLAVAVTDKEANRCVLQIMNKRRSSTKTTVADYLQSLRNDLITTMFSERLQELTHSTDAPFNGAYNYVSNIGRDAEAFAVYTFCDEKKIKTALKTVLVEMERASKFGFTQSELDRAIKSTLASYEKYYKERDKAKSENLISDYVYHFLRSEPASGIEFENNVVQKHLPGVTLAEINTLAAEWMSEKGRVIIATAPEKEGVDIPTDKEMLEINKEAKKTSIEAYKEVDVNKPLIAKLPPAGKVTLSAQNAETGFTQWTLSNGAKVLIKPTDFKNDEILFGAVSLGGTSLVKDGDFKSAEYATDIVEWVGVGEFSATDLEKKLSGKFLSIYNDISDFSESVRGQCAVKDFESFLQLAHLYMTSPRKDETAFQTYIKREESMLKNASLSPEKTFYDTLAMVIASNHLRSLPMTVERLNEIKYDRVLEVYKERFGNASDFTFIFVGNIDLEKHKALIEKYIGSLPAGKPREDWKDLGMRSPNGVVVKTVYKGKEPKSSVMVRFETKMPITPEIRLKINMACDVLAIKLRENMRESQGGVYGVGVSPSMSKYPTDNVVISIRFGCAPENVEKLIATVFEEIVKVKSQGITEEDMTKVRETMLRTAETNFKENNYWFNRAFVSVINKEELKGTTDETMQRIKNVTAKDIKKMVETVFNEGNHIKVILRPEKN